jgi:hypothetical protein
MTNIGGMTALTALFLASGCGGDPEPSGVAPGVSATATADSGGEVMGTASLPTTSSPLMPTAAVPSAPPVASTADDGAGGAGPAGEPPPMGDPAGTEASECTPGVPATSQVPRLTNAQYYRTLRDLLGVGPTGLLATEQTGDISRAEWDGYRFSADQVSELVMADPALRANYIRCEPDGDGSGCLTETIREFGPRAYRRPLSDEELTAYEGLIARRAELTETGSFDEIAELLLNAFLKSPHFLQRAELAELPNDSGQFMLTDYEVASRLSYLLWGTMPDEPLFEAAAAEKLRTPEQVLAQAERLAADDRARPVMSDFHREYLHMNSGRWTSAQKDANAFPAWSQAVVGDMVLETEMLFDEVFASGGSFDDLLTTDVAYVTRNTAPFYGLDPEVFDETPRATPLDSSRPGFLTRVGFLAAYGDGDKTDIINRGAFITKELLGIDPGIPDPAAATAQLPEDPALDTMRKRVAALTEEGVCATCHISLINPPGFVLEAFDTTGAAQTIERQTGALIDTRADVLFEVGSAPETIATPAELVARIAQSPGARRVYASKLVGFAYGRVLTGPDLCTSEGLAANMARGDSLRSLLVQVTQTNYFLTRSTEVTQ